MNIIYEYPPNYDAIAAAFNIKDHTGVIFTYGNNLYVPGGERIVIDKPLMKHEETHARQQRDMGITEWWDRFLADPEWRATQELAAYREQYRAMAGLAQDHIAGYLTHISRDLSSEIYGNVMTEEEAVKAITDGITLKFKLPSHGGNDAARKLKKRARQNRKAGRK